MRSKILVITSLASVFIASNVWADVPGSYCCPYACDEGGEFCLDLGNQDDCTAGCNAIDLSLYCQVGITITGYCRPSSQETQTAIPEVPSRFSALLVVAIGIMALTVKKFAGRAS